MPDAEHDAMSEQVNARAVSDGVCDAFLCVLDAMGGYPMTRGDMLDMIAEGVERAVTRWLDAHGLPTP